MSPAIVFYFVLVLVTPDHKIVSKVQTLDVCPDKRVVEQYLDSQIAKGALENYAAFCIATRKPTHA